MRFKLQNKVYNAAALDEITLRDLVLFNTQAEQMGLARKWSDVERVSRELAAMSRAEADGHPEKFLAIAVTIWATRRTQGDDVTLEQAIDFPMNAIEFLPEPEDRKPGKRKAPAKKAGAARKATRTSAADAADQAQPTTT